MVSMKIIVNLCVFIILVIEAELVRASVQMVKYEEPFPQRFPLQTVSQVAFTQYSDVPMLSLDEIKRGFPWLKISDESDRELSELRRSVKTRPRYIFYYVPTELTGSSNDKPGGEIGSKFRLQVNERIPKSESEFVRREKKGRKFLSEKLIKQPSKTVEKEPISKGINTERNKEDDEGKDTDEERRYERYNRKRNKEGKNGQSDISLTLRENERSKGQEKRKNRLIQNSETRQIPSYLYPKVPSRFMQPPRIEYEDKEFWMKKKRSSKRPIKNSDADEERLKNHKIVKKKKVKDVDSEKGDLKNHKPVYDREHDPEEHVESSNREVEKTRSQRPKKTPKNHSLLSQDGERVQFQIHGHEGPQTYIFGYDTGDGENRHFRIEERLRNGSVKGQYGYYDTNGKLKMVEYKASPMEGYIEEHHKSGEKKEDHSQRRR